MKKIPLHHDCRGKLISVTKQFSSSSHNLVSQVKKWDFQVIKYLIFTRDCELSCLSNNLREEEKMWAEKSLWLRESSLKILYSKKCLQNS